MLQMNNRTPFAASMSVLANRQGIDTVYLMVKGTFQLGKQWTLVDEQPEPQLADEYFGEPLESSLKAASDVHIGKAATDIIMKGHACAAEGYQAKAVDVELCVGHVSKQVRVFGDRYWDGGRISSPEPFETMPLVYEHAFGGMHREDDVIVSAEVRNPVGRGYVGKRSASMVDGTLLPNLEDPSALIAHPKDTPPPACFSYVAPNWQPRAGFAGTYDDQWLATRAPFLPHDFDSRFLNTASEGLIYRGFLQGGEPVKIANMHPRGELKFTLPVIKLKATARVAGRLQEVTLFLETLELEPNDLRVAFVWRGACIADKSANDVEEMTLNMVR